MLLSYANRNTRASDITMSVKDVGRAVAQCALMVTHDDLMATMRSWVEDGRIRPADLARELSIPSPRVTEMLKGRRRIQHREMPILTALFGLGGALDSNVRKIKRLGSVPAGGLRQAVEEATDTIEVPANLPADVFALEVDGESMNLIAPFGADVIVDPADKSLFSGDMYVLGDGSGGFTFKLFKQDPARLVPLSDDPAHETIPLGSQAIDIVGRVVSVQLGAGALRKLSRSFGDA